MFDLQPPRHISTLPDSADLGVAASRQLSGGRPVVGERAARPAGLPANDAATSRTQTRKRATAGLRAGETDSPTMGKRTPAPKIEWPSRGRAGARPSHNRAHWHD
jgi:hypothetical protein